MIPKFDKYVCVGDSVTWSVDGFDITATVHQDTDTRPTEFECYDDAQIQAWKDDDWFYCGVVLSVSRNGVEVSHHAASLWGIDCNLGEDNDYLSEVCEDLQSEALEQAKQDLVRIINALEH